MIKNITILYVEDEEEIRENTQRPLKYLCDKLIIGYDGKNGLELFKQHKPDIVVSDIKMPNMDGIEMCKQIKQINPSQNIIFTTAHSDNRYFIDAIDMQVDGYILKPIDYELLEQKIEKIIDNIKLKQQLIQQKEQLHKQELQILEQSKYIQMNELIKNIAHQWRQPLNVVSTSATNLILNKQLDTLTDDMFYKSCETITNTSQQLSKIIDTFKDYINEDRQYKQIILQDRILYAISIIKAILDEYNIKVYNNFDKIEPIYIKTIGKELDQVIINILTNSKDILVRNNISNKSIKLFLEKTDSKIILKIEDNGGGISEDIIDKIFDPYFTTKHQAQDVGLGLYIAKEIVEKSLLGSLKVSNGTDGACFTIELPL